MFTNKQLAWAAVLGTVVLGTASISYPAHPQVRITTIPVRPTELVPPRPTAKHILPPVEYDKPYDGDLTIHIVPDLVSLEAACSEGRKPTQLMLACAWHNAKSCVIYMVEDRVMREKGWNSGLLLRHEIAHCNGWPSDHPGEARKVPWPTTQFIAEGERIKR